MLLFLRDLREWCGLWMLKLGLIGLMFFNLGIAQSIHRSAQADKQTMSSAEFLRKQTTLDTWLDNLVVAAKAKPSYGATDYFQDLRQITKKEIELMGKYRSGAQIFRHTCELQDIERRGGQSSDYQISVEAEKYRYWLIDEKLEQPSEPVDWLKVGRWFRHSYLVNLLPAFLYLLVFCWHRRREDHGRAAWLPSPRRFALAVIGYPVTFFILVRNATRSWQFEAEYRRTLQRVFGEISPTDTERIKHLAHSTLALKEWRAILESEGRIKRHSLATAILATVLLGLAGQIATATDKKAPVVFDTDAIELISSNLARMSIDDEDEQSSTDSSSVALLPDPITAGYFGAVSWLRQCARCARPVKIVRTIDHVPVSAIQLRVSHNTG